MERARDFIAHIHSRSIVLGTEPYLSSLFAVNLRAGGGTGEKRPLRFSDVFERVVLLLSRGHQWINE